MADRFVAEIRIFAGNFPPSGWAFCNGQLLPISQNTALFSLLGTTYGGNGVSTFALPDLQGRMPMQQGQGQGLSLRDLGEVGGAAAVTLIASAMPAHRHGANAATTPGTPRLANPVGALWAPSETRPYAPAASAAASMLPLPPTGGNAPHNNLPPYLAVTFIIALSGIFPSRP